MLETTDTVFFFYYPAILWYEQIHEFSSDDLNSTLYHAALLLSCGQLTCTGLTRFCHSELCGTNLNGQTTVISCVTSLCGNRCKTLLTQNTCLVNIILLVAKTIPDNWRCFSFWHQIFVFRDFLLFIDHFSILLPATHSMSRGGVCLGTLN